jgi:uncharacterized delta-60 repeat protein
MPSYSGVWTLTAQYQAIGADNWANPTYWIATLGNPPGSAFGRNVALDSSGNVFACGYGYDGTGDERFVLAKYSSAGSIKWQRTLNNPVIDTDQGYAVAVDSSNNIYVTGYTGVSGGNVYDVIVAKYDTNGTVLWQKQLAAGTGSYDAGTGIAVDPSGNVYISGNTGASNTNMLAVKYNSAGTVLWQRTLSSGTEDIGLAMAVDSSGNAYLCGASDTSGSYDFQIAKYDTSGTIQWQRRLFGAGSSQDIARGIATDSSGNVYICGSGNAAGTYDIYVAKYDTSGTIQWQKRLGSASDDNGTGVAVDSSGNVYICGDNGSVPGILVAKYNSSGVLQWQRTLSSTSVQTFSGGIKVDTSGNFYVTGTTYYSTAFITFKLPTDGTLTGTYGPFIYAVSTMTDATPTFTSATSSLTSATSSLSESTPTLTNAAGPFTPLRVSVA